MSLMANICPERCREGNSRIQGFSLAHQQSTQPLKNWRLFLSLFSLSCVMLGLKLICSIKGSCGIFAPYRTQRPNQEFLCRHQVCLPPNEKGYPSSSFPVSQTSCIPPSIQPNGFHLPASLPDNPCLPQSLLVPSVLKYNHCVVCSSSGM